MALDIWYIVLKCFGCASFCTIASRFLDIKEKTAEPKKMNRFYENYLFVVMRCHISVQTSSFHIIRISLLNDNNNNKARNPKQETPTTNYTHTLHTVSHHSNYWHHLSHFICINWFLFSFNFQLPYNFGFDIGFDPFRTQTGILISF